MLVLSRKQNETIIIDNNIIVRVIDIRGKMVRLGISAPDDCSIRRGELPVERIVEVQA